MCCLSLSLGGCLQQREKRERRGRKRKRQKMAREFVDWRLLLHGRLLGRRSSSTAAAAPRVQARIHYSFFSLSLSLSKVSRRLFHRHTLSLFPFLSPPLRPLLHLLVVTLLCLLWLSPLYTTTTTATAVSTRFIVAESSAKRPSSAQQLLLATVVVVVVVIWEHCCRCCCCCCDTGATRVSRKRRRRRQRPPPPENQLWRHQHFSAWVQLTHTHTQPRTVQQPKRDQ